MAPPKLSYPEWANEIIRSVNEVGNRMTKVEERIEKVERQSASTSKDVAVLARSMSDWMESRQASCPYQVNIHNGVRAAKTLDALQLKLLLAAITTGAVAGGGITLIIQAVGGG